MNSFQFLHWSINLVHNIRQIFTALSEQYTSLLMLQDWNIKFVFHHTQHAYVDAIHGDSLATAVVMWEYLEATVHVNVEALRNKPLSVIEEAYFHEMVHLHYATVQRKYSCTKREERLVTTLGRIIRRLASKD